MPDIDGNREGSKYLWKIYGKMERSRNFTKVWKSSGKLVGKALKNTCGTWKMNTLPNVPHVINVINVWCFICITHVIHTPVIHVKSTCNICVSHICNTRVYSTHVL